MNFPPKFWSRQLSTTAAGPLSESSIAFEELQHVSTDFDYIGLSSKAFMIFDLKSFTHNHFSQFSGEIYRQSSIKKVYSKRYKYVFLIGSIGAFYIAIVHSGIISKSETENLSFISIINQKLKRLSSHGNKLPYTDIRDSILTEFNDDHLFIFAHGQKMIVKETRALISSFVRQSSLYIEIAIGTEFFHKTHSISVLYQDLYSSFMYANFLSNLSCNILVKDQFHAANIFKDSYRSQIYDTLYHESSRIKKTLAKIPNKDIISDKNILFSFEPSIGDNLNNFLGLSSAISRSTIRFEGYFVINKGRFTT